MNATDIFIWGIFLGVCFFYYFNQKHKEYKRIRVQSRAKQGEKDAIVLLEKKGYRIIDIQARETVTIYIDEVAHQSTIIADYIVEKNRKNYIVEVKTGKQTTATVPYIRRQLLEYYLVFQPDGILLLDMEKKHIKEVEFICGIEKKEVIIQLIAAGLVGLFIGFLFWGVFA